MMRTCLLLWVLLVGCCRYHVLAQDRFRAMFYNVENLFDCTHDSLKNDWEFLPDGIRHWHPGRLRTKLQHLSQVIVVAGEWEPPVLVGVCEVENEQVMDQWVQHSPLRHCGYRYVMTRSADERGIDVALLWQRDRFRKLTHRSIRVEFPDNTFKPTRDVLHVSGRVLSGDTLDVFVCHLPSRAGGTKESDPARFRVASAVKHQIDSLCSIRHSPCILVMGDFNDPPASKTLCDGLMAHAPTGPFDPHRLYNLVAAPEDEGTYCYQGEWQQIDQMLVSGLLLSRTNGFRVDGKQTHVLRPPFLLEDDVRYQSKRPLRTYVGPQYKGGYSDHLPVILDFKTH